MESLPAELLTPIISFLVNPPDLRSLTLTCRRLNELATPFLYKNIVIYVSHKDSSLTRVCAGANEGLTRAKHIKQSLAVEALQIVQTTTLIANALTGALWDNQRFECVHGRDTLHSAAILKLCEDLTNDSLTSFCWKAACCVPKSILGPNGYLPRHQKKLKELALVTSGNCGRVHQGEDYLDLSKFTSLLDLSWVTPNSLHEFNALKICLSTNAAHLERLNLDIRNGPTRERVPIGANAHADRNGFFSQILGRVPPAPGTILSALRSLSLNSVYLTRGFPVQQFVQSFNLQNLKCLKLNTCPGANELMREVVGLGVHLRLKQFELVTLQGRQGRTYPEALPSFLESFNGLEDIFLCVSKDICEGDLGIRHHSATLNRLLLHPIVYDEFSPMRQIRTGDDADLDWFGWSVLRILWSQSDWEFFGTSTSPANLQKELELSPKKPTWAVLHLRTSGCVAERKILREQAQIENEEGKDMIRRRLQEDMVESSELAKGKARLVPTNQVEMRFSLLDFVIWAFGAEGLPNLQLIAYGDFTPKYADKTSLFRRDEVEIFCELGKQDVEALKLFEKHREALEACETTQVLR